MLDSPELNYIALTQDGVFGKCPAKLNMAGSGLGKRGSEHIVRIAIDVKTESGLRLVDNFDWDITNPDNVPEEFAAALVSDLVLSSQQKATDRLWDLLCLEKLVALEIRRQIQFHCMRLASEFKANCEVISLSRDNRNAVQLLREQD